MGMRKFQDGTISVMVHLTLKPGRDDALIDLVLHAPRRALAPLVREAMRNGVRGSQSVDHVEEEFDLPDLSLEL
jgi:hypothetical protein